MIEFIGLFDTAWVYNLQLITALASAHSHVFTAVAR
jgi:hypothetical protein